MVVAGVNVGTVVIFKGFYSVDVNGTCVLLFKGAYVFVIESVLS